MRRGLASFGRDVRDHADLARELLEIHFVSLDVCTYQVVEGAVVRALRIFAVHQTHGRGYEVEVAAGSEGSVAHDVYRPEHAALTTACARVFCELLRSVKRVCVSQRAFLSLSQKHVCSRCSSQSFAAKRPSAVSRTLKPLDAESHAQQRSSGLQTEVCVAALERCCSRAQI